MSDKDDSRRGDYYVIDDRTGFKKWASETRVEWTGLRVDDPDLRHPQDLVKGRPERMRRGAFMRPKMTPVFAGEASGSPIGLLLALTWA